MNVDVASIAMTTCRVSTSGMELGIRIEEARRKKRLSQGGLGAAIGMQQSRISRWERGDGEPSIGQLIAIADACGVSLDYLARGEESQTVDALSPDELELIEMYRAWKPTKAAALRALARAADQCETPASATLLRPVRGIIEQKSEDGRVEDASGVKRRS